MKERGAKERRNHTYICTIPPFLRYGRNAVRYKGTRERPIYIGGSGGLLGGRGPEIFDTCADGDRGAAALKRPQVLTPFSGAIHGA